jgi:hypothetical protein
MCVFCATHENFLSPWGILALTSGLGPCRICADDSGGSGNDTKIRNKEFVGKDKEKVHMLDKDN